VNSSSPRLLAAIKAMGLARHELLEALQQEAPGQVVIRNGRAYTVVVRGVSPTLVVARAINLKPGKPASSPAAGGVRFRPHQDHHVLRHQPERNPTMFTRRNAIASAASTALASLVAAPGRLIAAIAPGPAHGRAQPVPIGPAGLPPFPAPGLSPDETLRRLVAWCGGPSEACLWVLAGISEGSILEAATDAQSEHVHALVDDLDAWIREESDGDG
jgi:hypothetical protein